MNIDTFPLLIFVLATTFSPGPNNISAAVMGVSVGYKKSLTYLIGIMSGFSLIMMLCALISSQILAVLPQLEIYLSYIGFIYILWLAYSTLTSSIQNDSKTVTQHAFTKGFVLQLINPKAIVYGLTLYSTFLVTLVDNLPYLIGSSVIFGLITFSAISTWSMFGSALRHQLTNPTLHRVINATLAMLLAYTAFTLLP